MSQERRRSQSYPVTGAVKPRSQEPLHEQIVDAKVDTSRVPDLKIDSKISPDYESYMTVYRIGRMVGENYVKVGEYVASIMGEFAVANSCRIRHDGCFTDLVCPHSQNGRYNRPFQGRGL